MRRVLNARTLMIVLVFPAAALITCVKALKHVRNTLAGSCTPCYLHWWQDNVLVEGDTIEAVVEESVTLMKGDRQ